MKYFVFRDENTSTKYQIHIVSGPTLDTDEFCEEFETILLEQKDELEHQYGTHDFETEGEDEIWGYTSYEFPPDMFGELLEKWRDVLGELGFTTAPWEKVEKES